MRRICLDENFEELDFVQPHEKKPVELYLLTCDGVPRDDPYGSFIYCIGVYPTEEEAMLVAINECQSKELDFAITPIILGETYPLRGESYSYENDKELGGYSYGYFEYAGKSTKHKKEYDCYWTKKKEEHK